jgi:hypothetical protein
LKGRGVTELLGNGVAVRVDGALERRGLGGGGVVVVVVEFGAKKLFGDFGSQNDANIVGAWGDEEGDIGAGNRLEEVDDFGGGDGVGGQLDDLLMSEVLTKVGRGGVRDWEEEEEEEERRRKERGRRMKRMKRKRMKRK